MFGCFCRGLRGFGGTAIGFLFRVAHRLHAFGIDGEGDVAGGFALGPRDLFLAALTGDPLLGFAGGVGRDITEAEERLLGVGGFATEPFNSVLPMACGNTGVQTAGWFNKEMNSVDDFKGLKMRTPGLGGEVLTAQLVLGATLIISTSLISALQPR